jgi:hypothetical protein
LVGFFLEIPQTAPEARYDVYMLGEVPGATNVSDTTDMTVAGALNLLGFPYPVSVAWTGTAMAATAPGEGDKLYKWTGSGYSVTTYESAGKGGGFAWSPADTMIDPGEGFFLDATTGGTAQEVKPYMWP